MDSIISLLIVAILVYLFLQIKQVIGSIDKVSQFMLMVYKANQEEDPEDPGADLEPLVDSGEKDQNPGAPGADPEPTAELEETPAKVKKTLTQKQKDALAKGRQTRSEHIADRKAEKSKQDRTVKKIAGEPGNEKNE